MSLRAGLFGLADKANCTFESSAEPTMLLIHGFNTSEFDALRPLGDFRSFVADHAHALKGRIYIVTWPGDLPVGAAAYPLVIENAREGANVFRERIEGWYNGRGGPQDLIIVAHSLGCRLALEFASKLDRGSVPDLRSLTVFLMAAAVPVGLEDLIGDAIRNVDSLCVLTSTEDNVLRLAFPLGETFAREGWMPEAVGRHGEPWGLGWTASRRMSGFDHGDYWSGWLAPGVICDLLRSLLPDLRVRRVVPPPRLPPEYNAPRWPVL